MTTTASKHGLRAAATERRNRHAQRTPLPPRAGQVAAAKETPVQEFNRLNAIPITQQTAKVRARIRTLANHPDNCAFPPAEKAAKAKKAATQTRTQPAAVDTGESKSEPKAQQFRGVLEQHGWSVKIDMLDGDVAETTARRGDETLWISWRAGRMIDEPMPTYTIGDRTIKMRNASQCRQYAARPPETATQELVRVSTNKAFRKKATEPKRARLPFDPALATDEEVISALLGKAVTWHNSRTQGSEVGQVGTDAHKVELVTSEGGDRIFKFCCPNTGFRAFRLSALIKVGGRAVVTKGMNSAANPEIMPEIRHRRKP